MKLIELAIYEYISHFVTNEPRVVKTQILIYQSEGNTQKDFYFI